ncbi:LysR family transcriptional regulator, partial [Xanthomonas oryzae pv. oryzae]
SGALNELGSLLGAQLFDRIGKRLLLNDNGRALLP